MSYRNITIELLKKGGDWGYNRELQAWGNPPYDALPPPLGANTSSTESLDLGGVTARRMQIQPGDSRPTAPKNRPMLVIALNDWELDDGQGNTITKTRGEVEWLTAGMPLKVKNTGSQEARLVLLEF